MYNRINKLIVSIAVATLGATAVINISQPNNPFAQLVQAPVIHADSTDQDTANTVSVSFAPAYKAAVQKYIADYKADSSNTSQLTDDINAIYAASHDTTGPGKGGMKDSTIVVKYTGHTKNDAKVFKTRDGYGEDAALKALNSDEVNELQNTIVNAIKQIRQQLGITNDTGNITLNDTASDVTKVMTKSTFKGNVNPQLNSIFKQYGVSQDLVGDQGSSDFSDEGIVQWLSKDYLTFKTVKQYTLNQYISSSLFLKDTHLTKNWAIDDYNNTVGKQILGITTWQLDNITKKNIKNVYIGLWENRWQNNTYPDGGDHFYMIFIPATTDSFTGTDNDGNTVTNTDAYNNFASANTSDTAQVGSANIPDPNKTTSNKQTSAKKNTKKALIIKRDKAKAKKYEYHVKKNKVVTKHGKIVKHWAVKKHHIYDAYGYRIK